MVIEPAVPAEIPGDAGLQLGTAGQDCTARPAADAELAGQIELAHPGYHVWISDAGWWYATRLQTWAHGQAATVHGPGPGELRGALAAEEAATMGRAMTGWC